MRGTSSHLACAPSARTRIIWATLLLVVSTLTIGCASPGSAQSASDVQCPPGQSFDGTFCVVEQNIASKETPVEDEAASEPEPAEKEGIGEATASVDSEGERDGAPAVGQDAGEEGEATAEGEPSAQDAGNSDAQEAEQAEAAQLPQQSTAAPVDYAMAAQAGPVMQYFASAHLPAGARPVGVPFAGQFAEGQVLVKKVRLKRGSCTTIVGVGLPPITELHLQLVDPEAGVELAADPTRGPQAALGSREDCYLAEDDRSAVVIVTVEAGQGVAGVQVFQK